LGIVLCGKKKKVVSVTKDCKQTNKTIIT